MLNLPKNLKIVKVVILINQAPGRVIYSSAKVELNKACSKMHLSHLKFTAQKRNAFENATIHRDAVRQI